MMKALLVACLLLAPAASPVKADDPVGIGFAQAGEDTWWCRGSDADKTLACASDKCRAEAGGQNCVATRWCGLAGWSGLMVIWLPESRHTSILCGAPSEAAATEALKALCANDEVVTRCDLVRIIDPDGHERTVNDVSWPGPTSHEPAAAEGAPVE